MVCGVWQVGSGAPSIPVPGYSCCRLLDYSSRSQRVPWRELRVSWGKCLELVAGAAPHSVEYFIAIGEASVELFVVLMREPS